MVDNNENILAQIRQLRAEAGKTLQGNEYFAVAHRLDAIMAGGDTGGAAAETKLQAIRAGLGVADQTASGAPNEILEHAMSLRAKAGEKLHGNGYFGVAHKLDALLASDGLTSASARDALDEIRSLIENGPPSAAPAQSPAVSQQPPKVETQTAPEPEAVQTIMFPKANSFGTPQPTVAINYGSVEEAEKPAAEAEPENAPAETEAPAPTSHAAAETSPLNSHHAPEAEEKTGFDALTEASWRRVREVAGADEFAMRGLNGAAAGGMTARRPEPAHEAAAEIAQAEETAETDAVEAASEWTESAVTAVEEIQVEPAERSAPAPQPEPASAPMMEVEMSSAIEPETESRSDGGTVTAAAEYQEPFRVIPRPTIINRPVKAERFARLKRLAKLPYLPKRKK